MGVSLVHLYVAKVVNMSLNGSADDGSRSTRKSIAPVANLHEFLILSQIQLYFLCGLQFRARQVYFL